ncbi:C4-type zinc ribbon domain-containing protein [Eubacteriales bacterium OttesenSCG-928-M02]|nr:C4-type zinc ribbon domain-containing protein [Eubacteriales bacterium OttesenSCG-928-M02]
MDYQALWNYQLADLDLNRFERKLRQSDVRKQLLEVRNFLLEQQNRVKQVEVDVASGQKETVRINLDIKKTLERFQALEKELDGIEEDDISTLRRLMKELDGLNKTLNGLNKELSSINKMAYGVENTIKDAYVKIQKSKGEFEDLKAKHDQELESSRGELEALQEKVAEEEKHVDATLLEKYKQIKKNRVNPLAKVVDGCCSGCNMTIPSLVQRKLREGEDIIECESCGRILFYEDANETVVRS